MYTFEIATFLYAFSHVHRYALCYALLDCFAEAERGIDLSLSRGGDRGEIEKFVEIE